MKTNISNIIIAIIVMILANYLVYIAVNQWAVPHDIITGMLIGWVTADLFSPYSP